MLSTLYTNLFSMPAKPDEQDEAAKKILYVFCLGMFLGSFFSPITLGLVFIVGYGVSKPEARLFISTQIQNVAKIGPIEKGLLYVQTQLGMNSK
jgi:hypothetical protein